MACSREGSDLLERLDSPRNLLVLVPELIMARADHKPDVRIPLGLPPEAGFRRWRFRLETPMDSTGEEVRFKDSIRDRPARIHTVGPNSRPQMSLQRQIRKLNRILLAETGQNPVREWMHSSDTRLLHPMRVYERDGSTVYDYHCQCGKNVRIHRSGCLLTVPQPRWEIQHLLNLTLPKERYADCWLVGCRTYPDKTWWEHSFNGCPYPSDGAWYPFSDRKGVLILNQGTSPDEDLNWELVKMIREWNDLRFGMDQAYTESQLLRKKSQDSKIDAATRDVISVSSRPGAKEEVSFPSLENEVGEHPLGSTLDRKQNARRVQLPVKPPLRSNQRTEFAPSLSQN